MLSHHVGMQYMLEGWRQNGTEGEERERERERGGGEREGGREGGSERERLASMGYQPSSHMHSKSQKSAFFCKILNFFVWYDMCT